MFLGPEDPVPLPAPILQTAIARRAPDRQGKVRDIYDFGDRLLIVATDRISAFDYVLGSGIPDKGKVLTQISAFWFDRTKDIVANHVISTDVKDYPKETRTELGVLNGRSMLVRRTDIVFLFVGDGADKQRLVQYAKGVPNVQFLPSVKHSEVWQYYAGADINLVCLKNIPDFDMFIPSKMFEIMAAEAPAVAALRGEGAALMQESGSALVVPSEDAEALAGAIETLADEPERRRKMAASGRAYVGKYFLHSRLASQYLMLMKKLVGAA